MIDIWIVEHFDYGYPTQYFFLKEETAKAFYEAKRANCNSLYQQTCWSLIKEEMTDD